MQRLCMISHPMIPLRGLARSFCSLMAVAILASQTATAESIVINELHYNPDVKTEPAEFVELVNAGTNAVNLAGWTLSSGFNYTFPATNVAPGRFVVVAQNPAFLQTKFTVSARSRRVPSP